MNNHKYFLLHKPYKVVSVFKSAHRKKVTLDQIGFSFPENTHAVGRLDENSEGLLVLTNDRSIDQIILHPEKKIEKTYWVQVHGEVDSEKMDLLRNGIVIRINSEDYKTLPCKVNRLTIPDYIKPRCKHPVSNEKKTTWLEITLTEGKFHQIRKMTAGIGHQTMRLIRARIGRIELNNSLPGAVWEITKEELSKQIL